MCLHVVLLSVDWPAINGAFCIGVRGAVFNYCLHLSRAFELMIELTLLRLWHGAARSGGQRGPPLQLACPALVCLES